MAFKQKKRVKNSRNKYLKPGALAQLRYSRTVARSCTDIGKKRVLLDSEKTEENLLPDNVVAQSNTPISTPARNNILSPADVIKLKKLPESPATPQALDYVSHSRLESLPIELLVKIMCHLHHDQLKAVFHVSRRVRSAVIQARQLYFNFTTPDRSRQEMLRTKTPLPTDHWPFTRKRDIKGIRRRSPHTPKAPRQGPRPTRLHVIDVKNVAAVLFPDATFPSRLMVPPGLPRPTNKHVPSTRVLVYEDELCKAVAQNKLL